MDKTFIQARIDKIKQQIEAHEDALLALGTGGAQSYELDTGQTKQRVTKLDVAKLNETLQSLYNQYTIWYGRLNGGNTIQVRPGW